MLSNVLSIQFSSYVLTMLYSKMALLLLCLSLKVLDILFFVSVYVPLLVSPLWCCPTEKLFEPVTIKDVERGTFLSDIQISGQSMSAFICTLFRSTCKVM